MRNGNLDFTVFIAREPERRAALDQAAFERPRPDRPKPCLYLTDHPHIALPGGDFETGSEQYPQSGTAPFARQQGDPLQLRKLGKPADAQSPDRAAICPQDEMSGAEIIAVKFLLIWTILFREENS